MAIGPDTLIAENMRLRSELERVNAARDVLQTELRKAYEQIPFESEFERNGFYAQALKASEKAGASA